jgi:hypothetical protein
MATFEQRDKQIRPESPIRRVGLIQSSSCTFSSVLRSHWLPLSGVIVGASRGGSIAVIAIYAVLTVIGSAGFANIMARKSSLRSESFCHGITQTAVTSYLHIKHSLSIYHT